MSEQDGDVIGEDQVEEEVMIGEGEGDEYVEEVETEAAGFFAHTDAIFTAAVSPTDSARVCTGGGDDRGFLWSAREPGQFHELGGHTDSVASVQFNHDGSLVATAGMDGLVKVWNVEDPTGSEPVNLVGPEEVTWCQFHPKGNAMLVGCADATAWLWLAPQKKCLHVFAGHSGPVTCGSFTPDGKKCITASEDASVRVWLPKTGECEHIFDHKFHRNPIICMEVASNNETLITGDARGRVFLSNIITGNVLGYLPGHDESVEGVAFAHDGQLAASVSMDHTLSVWDLNHMRARQTKKLPDGVNKLLWHPTQPLLLTACLDKTISLWDARSLDVAKSWTGLHTDIINDVAVASDWSTIVSVDDGGSALIFDPKQ